MYRSTKCFRLEMLTEHPVMVTHISRDWSQVASELTVPTPVSTGLLKALEVPLRMCVSSLMGQGVQTGSITTMILSSGPLGTQYHWVKGSLLRKAKCTFKVVMKDFSKLGLLVHTHSPILAPPTWYGLFSQLSTVKMNSFFLISSFVLFLYFRW